MDATKVFAKAVDAIMEGTVVGSFTKAGYLARSKLSGWEQPPSMAGQTALITGGTSGIGRATALGLMRLDADVIVTSRDQGRADRAATELGEDTPAGSVRGMAVDTGDHRSVRALIDRVKAETDRLDVLINNAGALTDDYNTDASGTELTLSSHLIGPYILTVGLKDHLAQGARVLWMSSGGMYTQALEVDEIELTEDNYKGAVAYAKAKRAQVELAVLLGPRWAPEVIMHAMHPGWVDTPGVDAGIPGFATVMGPTLRTAEQGADTMIWLAATGGDNATPGSFFLDRKPRRTSYLPGTKTTTGEREKLLNWLQTTSTSGQQS